MKNFILALFLLVISGAICNAQSFSLADDAGPIANGADVPQSGPSDTLQLITWLHLTNNSSNTLRVMMKKEEITMLPETSSSICWAGYCYGPEMMVSSEPLIMLPGETASGCFGHFGPHGSRGVSVIRWTFFSESNPNDSVSLTVQYSTYPAAVGSIGPLRHSITPACSLPADHQLVFRCSLPAGSHGVLQLRNQEGKTVAVNSMVPTSGTSEFNTSDLPSGIYYCTLVVNGKPAASLKVPVCH